MAFWLGNPFSESNLQNNKMLSSVIKL